MSDRPVVTRFAPSPTGFMHIGGVRTALFSYLWARRNGGTFILRIEDTDKEREVEGSIGHIQESLRWIGLEWEYGPDKPGPFGSCIQSERLDTYKRAAQTLIDKGLAYPDPYSAEEIDAFRRAAAAEKRPFLFRDHRPEAFHPWDGNRPLRFKVPEIKRMRWHDAVRGDLEAGEESLDDFIIIKSDGYPTYNFAHIIDDTAMGVTHVMRADEFISSTPKFLSLYEALGIAPPVMASLPPILREDKTKKLGKRDGAKDILEYRSEGYLPEAMLNFLTLIGWNPGTVQEIFSIDELIAQFDLSRIQAHGGVFNEEKLRWMNREYLSRFSDTEFFAYIDTALAEALSKRGIASDLESRRGTAQLMRERLSVASDVSGMIEEGEFDFAFADPAIEGALLPAKNESVEDVIRHLTYLRERFAKFSEDIMMRPESIKAELWDYATEEGRANVLWPLRYALSGREKSPDPFVISALIGRDAVLRRIDAALHILSPL